MEEEIEKFGAIVVGAGHAGVEAALALARTGIRTLNLSVTLDNVAYLACNPSIGGTAKGHLVREVDALGGEMGIATDKTLTQIRMLNGAKGPAVQSLRAQVDKYAYHEYMKAKLENQNGLLLKQAEVKELLCEDGKIRGVVTVGGMTYHSDVVVIATGVYLKSCIITGDVIEERGPVCFPRASYLSSSLASLGIELRRFKTGTPARVSRKSVDLSALEVQHGEDVPYTFSALSRRVNGKKEVCYLGYTNTRTHDIIKENLHLAPKYAGLIHGTGARYCPSIEDKIVRFADKDRHQFFLEPEGKGTDEMYVQGISTSLPAAVQKKMYRSIKGFEKVEIMRNAYAIEYDCIDPTELFPTLEHKRIKGLYFAGQIIGTSGYEEAAALGIAAGLNASLALRNKPPLIFDRANSYIGVMIDDLVTVGTDEPYRMMTSRSEYRLSLRQDNADIRLTEKGYRAGLVTKKRYAAYLKRRRAVEEIKAIADTPLKSETVAAVKSRTAAEIGNANTLSAFLRAGVEPSVLFKCVGGLDGKDRSAAFTAFSDIRYEGYLVRQERARAEAMRLSAMTLSPDTDYREISGLRLEAAEKLNKIKPLSIGQAASVRGVTPADINVLIIKLKKLS